jgi:hypothetical protein
LWWSWTELDLAGQGAFAIAARRLLLRLVPNTPRRPLKTMENVKELSASLSSYAKDGSQVSSVSPSSRVSQDVSLSPSSSVVSRAHC